MADELRDAITEAAAVAAYDVPVGVTVLAMPEMEAIRQALLQTDYTAWTELKEKFPSIVRWAIP